jgi:hypothetical protein
MAATTTRHTLNWFPEYGAGVHRGVEPQSPPRSWSPSYHQREGNTSMDDRSLIVLVAALLLFLIIVGFIVAYLFQPIPVG